jgi:hypothetical protein
MFGSAGLNCCVIAEPSSSVEPNNCQHLAVWAFAARMVLGLLILAGSELSRTRATFSCRPS